MADKRRKASATKARALSLHIGLNTVSASAYGGWTGPLAACEFDANDLAALARKQGMKATVLLTNKGTRANTLAGIRNAAKSLRAGDLFFLTYSGHGGQVPDVTGEEEVVHRGRVPPRSVVVAGTRAREFPAGSYQLQSALIIGQRRESTDQKTSLNEALRQFGVSV